MQNSSLVVVGTGIKYVSHLTNEASAYIKQSDKVLYLVNEPAIAEWIKHNSKQAESLEFLYSKYPLRKDCYKAITGFILDELRKQQHLCVVLYGHPAVYAEPGLEAVKLARTENYYAKILPAVSAEDCLFADLLIDPGTNGCHSCEATDFLLYKRKFDPRSHLILWQVDIIGVLTNPESHENKKGAQLLVQHLSKFYPPDHQVFLYEAAQYPGIDPIIQSIHLKDLPDATFSKISTLYVPPIKDNWYDADFINNLNLNIEDFYDGA